jgi:nucleoside-diphosphate-sugar epimerase
MVRQASRDADEVVGDLIDPSTLRLACKGVVTVFHCAGYAHSFSSLGDDDEKLHWQVNFEGTRNLIEAAGEAGVKRFVFLSSVKAMGDPGDVCADEAYSAPPNTTYGCSKLAAEQVVLESGKRYGMHVVNLRLSMVYGAGGRGNLERMARLVQRGLFPPLPETGNHRSLVHVNDVVDAIRLVSGDVIANGRTYIVASKEAPSGRALFDALRLILNLPKCKWSVPEVLLRSMGALGGAGQKALRRRMPMNPEIVERLLGSAWYSPARIERELGWFARVALKDGLTEMLADIVE